MNEGCRDEDVLHVLMTADHAFLEDPVRNLWKVYGATLDETELAVVTLILNARSLRIVTVHLPP